MTSTNWYSRIASRYTSALANKPANNFQMWALIWNNYVVVGPYAYVKAINTFIEKKIMKDDVFGGVSPTFVITQMLQCEAPVFPANGNIITDEMFTGEYGATAR
ncbi:hypothetical protein CTAM01_03013 [Colletotrichum tamarilloi]|uniref:Uncharacterized protein n=1 Tax=Colletotrichum tamarilloi TaxID=1209934 RepID=A0ABQ9RKW7_9PEZI|nr:uncharacterized protein CTAM01_03013 [Colletotrichum tamarilloi]KAK1506681.1 hypothetical protein CTAM01_03013 [Colletotrichum tamarilloi]